MSANPTPQDAYTQSSNPISRQPEESANTTLPNQNEQIGQPIPQTRAQESDATPTALNLGVSSSGPADEIEAAAISYTTSSSSSGSNAAASGTGGTDAQGRQIQNENVNAQMALATLGEGDVADAVERKSGTQKAPGSGGAEDGKKGDFASDLDRKKAEQAEARAAIKEDRKAGIDVDGGGSDLRAGVET